MITLNINKINSNLHIDGLNPFEFIIACYYNYCNCNDFHDLKCPCCGNGSLVFHKTYERHLSIYYNDDMHDITINITVCKCKHCSKIKGCQKYHAILPPFIFPYMIYEASTIIKALYDYYNKKKLKEILDRIHVSHKLFFDWIKKLKKYSLSASIILKINNDANKVIASLFNDNVNFLTSFYQVYKHPFFLFKLTCVPLCIIP